MVLLAKRYSLELGKDWSRYLVRNRTLTKDKKEILQIRSSGE